jgi:enoyl-CoA hydratase/carnithine racemase
MIDYSVQDSVAFIRFNRPDKLNALTNEGVEELAATLRRFDHDDDATVGVLHGAGRAFSTGADTKERLGAVADGQWDGRRLPNERPEILACDNWKPLIAAVHGYAIGHAFGTAMLCDLVVASLPGKARLSHVRGEGPAGNNRGPRHVTPARNAHRLFLAAR